MWIGVVIVVGVMLIRRGREDTRHVEGGAVLRNVYKRGKRRCRFARE